MESRWVMAGLAEMDSRMSSPASARAESKETKDEAMLEVKALSAFGILENGVSWE